MSAGMREATAAFNPRKQKPVRIAPDGLCKYAKGGGLGV